MSLPSPRQFVTQLLASLPAAHPDCELGTNPLNAVPDSARKRLLTLQVLFPNEFLPALDLLDRGLVVRLRISESGGADESTRETRTSIEHDSPSQNAIYLVRSAQPRPSRFATSTDTTTCYQVRLLAWNCSCPAFAFAAFPATLSEPAQHSDGEMEMGRVESFGGATLGSGTPPVCKHLLACVLVERCEGLFGGYVVERRAGVGEAAGWLAGWGD